MVECKIIRGFLDVMLKGLCYFWTKSKVLSLSLKWMMMMMIMIKILLPKKDFKMVSYFLYLD